MVAGTKENRRGYQREDMRTPFIPLFICKMRVLSLVFKDRNNTYWNYHLFVSWFICGFILIISLAVSYLFNQTVSHLRGNVFFILVSAALKGAQAHSEYSTVCCINEHCRWGVNVLTIVSLVDFLYKMKLSLPKEFRGRNRTRNERPCLPQSPKVRATHFKHRTLILRNLQIPSQQACHIRKLSWDNVCGPCWLENTVTTIRCLKCLWTVLGTESSFVTWAHLWLNP